MSHIFALLSAIVFATCAAPHFVDARDHLSPHQRLILESKSPPAVEYRFSFDLPAGPQFTEAEKEALPLPLGELKGVAEAPTDGEARLESDGEGVSDGEGDEDVEGPSERVGDAV